MPIEKAIIWAKSVTLRVVPVACQPTPAWLAM